MKIKTIPCNNLGENCYIASDDTKECMIVDCGAISDAEHKAISDYIKQEGLTPVIHVLTHGHFDHTMGSAWLYDTYGLQPVIHERDAELYKNWRNDATLMGYTNIQFELPVIGRCLNDGDEVSFGNTTFKVIHTPGHSKGSVIYYCQDEHCAFSGDTLFRGCIGRTDLPGGSMFQMIQSLRVVQHLPGNTDVYPGHGAATTMDYEGQTNMYLE